MRILIWLLYLATSLEISALADSLVKGFWEQMGLTVLLIIPAAVLKQIADKTLEAL